MKSLRIIVHRAVVMGLLSCACGSWLAVAASIQTVTVESRTITARIERPFDEVYEFLVDPANWNQWAFGQDRNIRRSQDGWIADSDSGVARVQFTGRNSFGVVDHTVIHASGQRVYVPMRLLGNGSGCELLFTLFREPSMSDAQFASDAGFVERDLSGLKRLLEK
jgi:hypothetical protein